MPRGVRVNSNQSVPVSVKSTKQELLTAYQKLAEKLANQDKLSLEQENFFHCPPASAPSKPLVQLETDLGELEKKLHLSLQELTEKILSSAKELETIKNEIEQTRKQLSDDYKIKAEASSLQNLLQIKLEEQAIWESKIADLQTQFARESEELQKKREREVEEYQYNLSYQRRQEDDERKQKIKTETEKLQHTWEQREEQLKKREQEIASQEDELKTLQAKVISLEKQLVIDVDKAVKETKEKITSALKSEFELQKKDYELTQKLQAQNITNLEKIIKANDTEITNLKNRLNQGLAQVTDLASQVISSRQPLIISTEDKTTTVKDKT